MKLLILSVNVLAWPVIQLGFAWWMLSRPRKDFEADHWIARLRRWENRGLIYRRVFGVHYWKTWLPDAATWFGSPAIKRANRNLKDVEIFLAETRRAELAHWYMLACTPILFLWNPPWARLVMLAYGLAANLPCILAQRYNRAKLMLIYHRIRLEPRTFDVPLY